VVAGASVLLLLLLGTGPAAPDADANAAAPEPEAEPPPPEPGAALPEAGEKRPERPPSSPVTPGQAPSAANLVPRAPGTVPERAAVLKGTLKLKPRGVFIVNTGFNSGTLVPGSFAFYAVPPALSETQFFISPANSVLGFTLSGLSVRDTQLSGGLDVTLRSPQPLLTANTISPQFYDVHIEIDGRLLRIIVGQYPDVLLPFVPDTVNSIPSSYIPGAIGYARPQLRADLRLPLGEASQIILNGALAQPVQTFQLTDAAVGRQGGVPDVQGRVAFALGRSMLPWNRPFEIGVAGHAGRRRLTLIPADMTQPPVTLTFQTWSLDTDLRLVFPTGTQIKARFWFGSVLGDYSAAIFQTVDAGTRRGIHAAGYWADVQQRLSERWRVALGYGNDNPRNSDLSAGARSLNQAMFLNAFWDLSAMLGFGAEVSRWATTYVAAGENRVWRSEVVFTMRF
jgi:hypothetical protein